MYRLAELKLTTISTWKRMRRYRRTAIIIQMRVWHKWQENSRSPSTEDGMSCSQIDTGVGVPFGICDAHRSQAIPQRQFNEKSDLNPTHSALLLNYSNSEPVPSYRDSDGNVDSPSRHSTPFREN